MSNVYGYVNGEAVYSSEEFRYKARGFGEITDDNELIAYAEKVTNGWSYACWKRSFTTFYLSDYALSEPYKSLTHKEFERLKELQKIAIEEERKAEELKEWKYKETIYWADNSVEEIWENKFGEQKTVTAIAPHGDLC